MLEECAPRAQDFTCQRYRYKNRIDEIERARNRTKAKVRSKVEHVFAVMKLKFGFVKVRYRGIAKNDKGYQYKPEGFAVQPATGFLVTEFQVPAGLVPRLRIGPHGQIRAESEG